MDLIDIHCHILPGVDDGARSMEESLAMLRIAQENAIRTIILTPHNKPDGSLRLSIPFTILPGYMAFPLRIF